MDGAIAILLIALAMFLGCFLLGLIPLVMKLSEQKLQFVSVLGAGLLCGTALAVIIPEGIELLEDSSRVLVQCSNLSESRLSQEASAEESPSVSSHFIIGVSLVVGFILMFAVDQISSYCCYHDPRTGLSSSISITATLGLVIHAAADGVALGAAVASSQVTIQIIVFLAIILHKSGSSSQHKLSATGIGMLFSAGTFLYVAMVHVLPEVSNGSHSHHHGASDYAQKGLGILESLTLIMGAVVPVLLSLGLHD
ncbi:zinc transporter ZIP9-A isoform X2 [Latimeria chalumnae]|uniref:zinc transporter ZIP9-A isoform X2 n=1 Tax=Latimeria chalumnae TaxID=7897 RepID=UPI00313AC8D6